MCVQWIIIKFKAFIYNKNFKNVHIIYGTNMELGRIYFWGIIKALIWKHRTFTHKNNSAYCINQTKIIIFSLTYYSLKSKLLYDMANQNYDISKCKHA